MYGLLRFFYGIELFALMGSEKSDKNMKYFKKVIKHVRYSILSIFMIQIDRFFE